MYSWWVERGVRCVPLSQYKCLCCTNQRGDEMKVFEEMEVLSLLLSASGEQPEGSRFDDFSPAEAQTWATESEERRGEERRGELCRVLLYCPTHPVRLCTVLLQPRLLLRVQILTHISAWVPFTSYNESDSIRASGHLNIWFSRETRTARIRHFVLRLSNSRTLLVSTSFSRPPHFTICRWLLRKFGLSFLSEVTHYLFWEDIKFFPKKCV